jgi:hypothetical protein
MSDRIGKAGTIFHSCNSAKLLLHLSNFINRRCHVNPKCLNIHPANLIRLAYPRYKHALPPILFSFKCSHLEETKRIKGVPLCLFVKTSPINLAGMGKNRNESFTGKQHGQIANNPQMPQSRLKMNDIPPSQPNSFFLTFYL